MESGILELYVLGQLNAQEQVEVEAMIAKNPVLKQEVEAIELAMEQYALQHALPPAPALQDKIFQKINEIKTHAPAKEATVVQLQPQTNTSNTVKLRWALVACVFLWIASLVALFNAYHQLDNAKAQIASLNVDKEKFAATVGYMKQTNTDLQKISNMLNNPDWKIVKLAGTAMDPSANMVVYWQPSGSEVMVDYSKMSLPANDQEHQYQLWALVDGKPVDLGVFDVSADATQILLDMKPIGTAQTFAVTLEKRGGVESPTMDQMIVAGNVSI